MMTTTNVPDEIGAGRLVLRRWGPEHAAALKAAVDESLPHLRAWMPWAMSEPTPLPDLEVRLAGFSADFGAGRAWLYGIFPLDGGGMLGGLGLHPVPTPAPNDAPYRIAIGYWLRAGATGRGYATEAVRAAIGAVVSLPHVTGFEIRCDPDNAASAAVARRIGFRHTETLRADATTPLGAPRDTMIWSHP